MNKNGLYIQLYNIHGLIRGYNLELGRDADTGGQTKYVLELAKSLSERDDVRKVEIVTRRIEDKEVSKDYSKREEKVNEKLSIVRIRCGGLKYIRKELLWNHLEEFVDKSIKYIKSKEELPDIIHSHYADAGYVCTELTKFFGIPLIHTGHSLGRDKLNNLLKNGLTEEEINKRYKINQRIAAEESVIFFADRIVTSTNQEIKKQYGLYENTNEDKFVVIPPGVSLERFHPYNEKREWNDEEREVRENIREELWRFFTNLNKPLILSLCRPEKRKNISGLINAYGRDKELQKKANLAIFAGIRKDIQKMADIEQEVLTEILLLLDKYNLYGKMAIPKTHDVDEEVPELYRIAAETGGVFVNSAFNEPFGLTLIEAAASGLPVADRETFLQTLITVNLSTFPNRITLQKAFTKF
jgi:sucrose-phosphate synthase